MDYSMTSTDIIVLCPINITADMILHFSQTLTFSPVEMAIYRSHTISPVDMTVLIFQSSDFRACDLAAANSLANALCLSMISVI
jgi:hypothetical protein